MVYGKHRGAAKNRGAFLTTVATNVALGRPIVFPVKQVMDIVGLRISPTELEEEMKLRVIHDLIFGAWWQYERKRERVNRK